MYGKISKNKQTYENHLYPILTEGWSLKSLTAIAAVTNGLRAIEKKNTDVVPSVTVDFGSI